MSTHNIYIAVFYLYMLCVRIHMCMYILASPEGNVARLFSERLFLGSFFPFIFRLFGQLPLRLPFHTPFCFPLAHGQTDGRWTERGFPKRSVGPLSPAVSWNDTAVSG